MDAARFADEVRFCLFVEGVRLAVVAMRWRRDVACSLRGLQGGLVFALVASLATWPLLDDLADGAGASQGGTAGRHSRRAQDNGTAGRKLPPEQVGLKLPHM